MRMVREVCRAASRAGITVELNSRMASCRERKTISLVIIASTTATVNASASPRLSAATSSARLPRPALRATGSKRLSTRYCLSADRTRPERCLQAFAQEIVVLRRHGRSPANRRLIFEPICGERKHRGTQARHARPNAAFPTPRWSLRLVRSRCRLRLRFLQRRACRRSPSR